MYEVIFDALKIKPNNRIEFQELRNNSDYKIMSINFVKQYEGKSIHKSK